jgi:hypothetical protein
MMDGLRHVVMIEYIGMNRQYSNIFRDCYCAESRDGRDRQANILRDLSGGIDRKIDS